MKLNLLFLIPLMALILSACESGYDGSQVLRSKNGFSVVSVQRSYSNPSTGGLTQYGEYKFKFLGIPMDPGKVSAALFPEGKQCHDVFYRVSDVRLLSDNAVLAMFRISNSFCELGEHFVAKIYVKNARLTVNRIHVANDTAKIDNGVFMIRVGDKMTITPNEHAQRLLEQMDETLKPVYLRIYPLNDAEDRLIRIDLRNLDQIDLGEGEVMRFVGDDKVLMLHIPRRNKRPVANVRLVRLSDGATLANQTLRVACLRLVGKEANSRALSQLYMLEQNERNVAYGTAVNGQEIDFPKPSGVTDFDQETLPEPAQTTSNWVVGDILREQLVVDIKDSDLTLNIGKELRFSKRCR